MMLRFRGQLVLLFICLSLIGTQSVVQDDDQNSVQTGAQDGAQSVVQDSAQSGVQIGAQDSVQNGVQDDVQNDPQNGVQNSAQSINSDVCLLHDPPNSPAISFDSNTCQEQRFRVNTNSKEVILQGYFEDVEKVKDETLYQYNFGNCLMGFKIHNSDPIKVEPLIEFLTLNGFPPPYNIKYRLGLTFSLKETEIYVYDGYNAFKLPCSPLSKIESNYVEFDFERKISVSPSGYSLLFVGGVSDSDVTELGLPPAVIQTTTLVPSTSLSSSSSSSTSGVVTTTTADPSVLTTTVSSSTSSSTTTTSKPTTTTSKSTTTTSKPPTTTPKPSTSSSTTTKATTSSLTSTILSSTVEPSSGPDQSNLQQEKTTSNNKPLKITLFVLLLIAVAALFVILALFGVVFYRMKKGIKSTFIGNKSVTQETI